MLTLLIVLMSKVLMPVVRLFLRARAVWTELELQAQPIGRDLEAEMEGCSRNLVISNSTEGPLLGGKALPKSPLSGSILIEACSDSSNLTIVPIHLGTIRIHLLLLLLQTMGQPLLELFRTTRDAT